MQLEILYNTSSLIIQAWNADESQQGNFHPTPEEDVVVFPIEVPSFDSDWYLVDLYGRTIIGNPLYDPFTPDERRAHDLLKNSPEVITMPEIWELLRIFGRFRGLCD